MPFSQSSQLSSIVGFFEEFKPTSLLDVGVGMGQYGFLARTNLENINLFEIGGSHATQRKKSDWNIIIDGIEVYKKYQTAVHEYAYNTIFWGEALTVLEGIKENSYDLVFAIDILEHFTTSDGKQFLTHLQRVAKRGVLISTPKEFIPQEIEANPYENHRSVWCLEQLQEISFEQILPNKESWITVYNKD